MPKPTWPYIKQELAANWWEMAYITWFILVLTLLTIFP